MEVLDSFEDATGPTSSFPYTRPVLLIASDLNSLTGIATQRQHVKLFPSAILKTISNSGHYMFYDQPEATLAVIRDYFSCDMK